MLNKKGFTLVELLVVIIVISVLSGIVLSVVNVTSIRGRSRDSQRKTDLSKIRTALELYYTDNRSYPPSASGDWIDINDTPNALSTALVSNYIDVLPSDPRYNSSVNAPNPCSRNADGSGDLDFRYNYRTPSTGAPFYILTAIMENPTSDDDSKCSSLTNWSKNTCGSGSSSCRCSSGDTYQGTLDYCYGVQNPF